MCFTVKNTNFGKLVLVNKRVLPLGDYSLPVQVLSLTDVTAIHANFKLFVVETTKHFYIFNADTCKCICKHKQKQRPNFHIFTDYIILYDSIYDQDITDVALEEDYPIISALKNCDTVYIAANNAIIRSSSLYYYYSSPKSEPVLISSLLSEGGYTYKLNSNMIASIHPSSSGKFIIRTTNNKILLFELLFDKDLDPYCMWLSKLMDVCGFLSTNIKIYPTYKQFLLTDNVNMFLFPLGNDICLSQDEYANKIKRCTYPIQSNIITVTSDAQIALDTNGDIYIYDFTNNLVGYERRKFDVNVKVKSLSAFDNGFYADTVYYPMFVTLARAWNTQQIKNYIYTMGVCAGLRNTKLLNYLYANP